MLLEILKIKSIEEKNVIRILKNKLFWERTCFQRFKNITWLEKNYVIRYFKKINWFEKEFFLEISKHNLIRQRICYYRF